MKWRESCTILDHFHRLSQRHHLSSAFWVARLAQQVIIDATSAVRIASPWSPHHLDCSDVGPPARFDFQEKRKDQPGDVTRAWERALARVLERCCDADEPQTLKLAL